MRPTAEGRGWPDSAVVRKWGIRVVVVLFAFEVVYVVGANALLRTGRLAELINKKPEKTLISWESVATYLPGFVKVTDFELRSQTKKDQVYLHVAEATARISLLELPFKIIHIRGVDAADVDFRYRERLDRPPKPGHEGEARRPPANVEYFPEIPGLTNPPDPKPEDLYPRKRKKHPWTIKITGAEVEGPIRVALNGARLESDGRVGGGVTVKPKRSVEIHRGRLELRPAVITFNREIVTDDLMIDADLRIDTFPAKGAKPADVLEGVSGELSIAGRLSDKGSLSHRITPGISWSGSGTVTADLKLKKGVPRAGSTYSVQSGAARVRLMGLDFSGSATVSSSTESGKRAPVTFTRIGFDDFRVVEAQDGSIAAVGTGLELNAEWQGFSITETVPASHVDLMLPPAQIVDVSVFNVLIPEQADLSLESGTGEVEARLEVNEGVAVGNLDLLADDIVLRTRDAPVHADLELHARLADGDLPAKKFNFAGTTIRLDDIADNATSERKKQKLERWFCDIELQRGTVAFDRPLVVNGFVDLALADTRPVTALLRRLGTGLKWLALAPNIKDVAGTMEVDIQKDYLAVKEINLTGNGFETMGWTCVRGKKTDGRIFARLEGVKAGVAIDGGKAKFVLNKPREWFEEQPQGPE